MKTFFVVLTLLLVVAGCDSSVEVGQEGSTGDELVSLIAGLEPDGYMQLSRQPDTLLPSATSGDSGTLSNGLHWRVLTTAGEAWGLAFADGHGKTAAVTIDCQVRTDAGKLKQISFGKCVNRLTDVYDGADVYKDGDTGYTNAEGYNHVYDERGNVVGRDDCGFPEDSGS